MKTNTFIIIVTAYTLLLGVASLFFPAFALQYFAGEPDNVQQQSLMNFIGAYQIAMAGMGYHLWKSEDKGSRKMWLLMVAFLTIIAIVLALYNKMVRMIPLGDNYVIDFAIWGLIAAAALYFRSKE